MRVVGQIIASNWLCVLSLVALVGQVALNIKVNRDYAPLDNKNTDTHEKTLHRGALLK